jgi:phosphoglycerol transferase MdoB-like AlkP superfamily enzyme
MPDKKSSNQPDFWMIAELTAGYVLPQLGYSWTRQLGWIALIFPLLGAGALYLAQRRHPAKVYKRLLPWGFVLAAAMFAAQLISL